MILLFSSEYISEQSLDGPLPPPSSTPSSGRGRKRAQVANDDKKNKKAPVRHGVLLQSRQSRKNSSFSSTPRRVNILDVQYSKGLSGSS